MSSDMNNIIWDIVSCQVHDRIIAEAFTHWTVMTDIE
jgi:hypothetical protein